MPEQEALLHYGIRGMKWGVIRKNPHNAGPDPDPVPVEVTSRRSPKTTVQAKGGSFHPPSQDAVNVAGLRQRGRSSGVSTLSNAEINAIVKRMELEQKYVKAITPPPTIWQKLFRSGVKVAEQKASEAAKQYANKQLQAIMSGQKPTVNPTKKDSKA